MFYFLNRTEEANSNSSKALDWIYHQNCFLFQVSELHNKDDRTNEFCLPCVNCVISFHLGGFWDDFSRAFFIRLLLLHKKNEKAGNFVRLLDRVTHRKRPTLPISTHRNATIFRDLALKIFDHIRSKKSSWSNTFYRFICTLENCSRTDFGFPHMIRTDISVLFGHVKSQTLLRYHTQDKF